MTEPVAVAEQVAAIAKKSHKPVLVVWMGGAQIEPARQVFREAVVPNYRTPDTAVECIASIVAHHENQQLLLQAPPPLSNTKAPDVDGAKAIIEHALHLCLQRFRLMQCPLFCQPEQLFVRDAAPEEVRQSRGQFVVSKSTNAAIIR